MLRYFVGNWINFINLTLLNKCVWRRVKKNSLYIDLYAYAEKLIKTDLNRGSGLSVAIWTRTRK